MRRDASEAIGQLITDKTSGRPYVFVIMSYRKRYDLFKQVQAIAGEFGLACIRADDIEGSGQDLLGKVHLLIERAEIVVAEISDSSANVFYEVGYAVALQKPPVLLIEGRKKVPTDLLGKEVIRHDGSRQADKQFEDRVRQALQFFART